MKKISVKGIKNSVAAIVFAFLMMFNTLPASAASMSTLEQNDQDIEYASFMIAGIMDMIVNQYATYDVSVQELYEACMRGMMEILDDYSQYFSDTEMEAFLQQITAQVYGIGVYLSETSIGDIIINSLINGQPAESAGIKKGDIIRAVNGKNVKGLKTDEVSALIKDKNTEIVSLTMDRAGTEMSFEITKAQIVLPTAVLGKFEDLTEAAKGKDNLKLGYIAIDQVAENTSSELSEIIKKLKDQGVTRLAIDMRGNPGGQLSVAIDICRQLVPEGPIVYVVDKDGVKTTYSSQLKKSPFEKIVVLTDANTASAAEIIAGAMQDAGVATIVGQTTYGKGVVQVLHQFGSGDGIKLTEMEYFRRSGEKVHTVGIKPDVYVDIPNYIDDISGFVHNNGTFAGLDSAKEILKFLGYKAGENGSGYDDATKESVTAFQKKIGLRQTGICDYETQLSLNSALYSAIQENDIVLKEAYNILINE